MEKKQLILVGAGGHCKSCIDVVERENKYTIAGLLDRDLTRGEPLLSYHVLGTDSLIPELVLDQYHFLITVGQIGSALVRKKLFETIKSLGGVLATVCSPYAVVASGATIGEGTIVMHHAVVNAGATIGTNCIINTKANVEHDSTIGNHTHISTNAVVNGNCIIGSEVFLGSQCAVKNNVTIADNTVIGIGSVVLHNIDRPGIYAGNPVHELRRADEE